MEQPIKKGQIYGSWAYDGENGLSIPDMRYNQSDLTEAEKSNLENSKDITKAWQTKNDNVTEWNTQVQEAKASLDKLREEK